MGHRTAVLTVDLKAEAAAKSYVLHVVSANCGGVDRYLRCICAHWLRDQILHVVSEQCVDCAQQGGRFSRCRGVR